MILSGSDFGGIEMETPQDEVFEYNGLMFRKYDNDTATFISTVEEYNARLNAFVESTPLTVEEEVIADTNQDAVVTVEEKKSFWKTIFG